VDFAGPDSLASITEFISLFPRLEIEIGSGNGHFLVNYALKAEKTGFIGVEIKKKRCLKIMKKVSSNNLSSVRIYQGDAEEFLRCLPAGVVDAVHIYFPDPWPKTKHRKRRFLKMPMLDTMHHCLKPSGMVYFASDVFDYFMQSKILCILHKGFLLQTGRLPAEVFSSDYSKKTRQAGRNINSLVASKSGF